MFDNAFSKENLDEFLDKYLETPDGADPAQYRQVVHAVFVKAIDDQPEQRISITWAAVILITMFNAYGAILSLAFSPSA